MSANLTEYPFLDLIEEVAERNTSLEYGLEDIVGVTIEKGLIPTIANLTQTALDKFYIVKPDTFVYNPRTHGVRLGMGYNDTDKTFITSWNNVAFFVKEDAKKIVLSEYLWIYFNRSEWDRQTNFMAWGSSTIVFAWNDFLSIKIQLPDLKEQQKIVNTYNAITKRIQLKQKINENLEKTAILKLENMLDDESLEKKTIKIESICEVKGGKRLPLDSDLIENRNSHPYIRIRDIKENCFVILNNNFLYVDDETQKEIARYITETNDLLISIVGTIGLTAIVHKSLDKANLTENCVKLTKMKNLIPEYVLIYLRSKAGQYAISQATVGAVQAKLPLKNIQNLNIPYFDDSIMKEYNDFLRKTFTCISDNLEEIIKLQSFRQLVISRISGM